PPQTDILQQKVSVTYQNATLQEVLTDLQEQYGLKFAYLNNELPVEQLVTLSFQNVPLSQVLDTALSNTSLSYQLVNGQIVLKNDTEKTEQSVAKPEIEETSKSNSSSNAEKSDNQVPTAEPSASTKDNGMPEEERNSKTDDSQNEELPSDDSRDDELQNDRPSVDVSEPEVQSSEKIEEPVQTASSADTTSIKEEATEVPAEQESSSGSSDDKIYEKITRTIRRGMNYAIFNHMPNDSPYKRSLVHFGLIYPLSTNGLQAGEYVNRLSLHMLVGYAAGLDGVEASGFGNIENDFVNGAQFAGFFNLVKNEVTGVQAAGFINLNGGTLDGGQFAGFLNMNLDSLEGVQGAGFLNLSTGFTRGVQAAGFANIATQNADEDALQASGFTNIALGHLKGGQFTGFGNYAHNVDGVQIAGFANIASGDVRGFQGSGFINVARNVKGVQLSVFNVADSIDGVPIGFLSIVRKNGYRALEVWGGETMHANVAFKIGVRKFYNIFSFGSQFADTDFRYGVGYGIGHVTALSHTTDLSIDLLWQQVYGDQNQIFEMNNILNLLSTFRLGFAKQFSQHFGVFIAPTFNLLVSELPNIDSTIGSNLAPYTFFNQTYNNQTNVQMWAGFNVGLRF
ncbi:MAG: secretin and TonB N-terminal domain-containing protein, partial [Tunicatimonas sp.]|uniref:STN domain-containing protein n=1 Tax=Tunicatimonas sp. TaxID=1940096 RepID=UPI003C752083